MANTIDLLGDITTFERLVSGTLASYVDDQLKTIKSPSPLYGISSLTSVDLPNLKYFICPTSTNMTSGNYLGSLNLSSLNLSSLAYVSGHPYVSDLLGCKLLSSEFTFDNLSYYSWNANIGISVNTLNLPKLRFTLSNGRMFEYLSCVNINLPMISGSLGTITSSTIRTMKIGGVVSFERVRCSSLSSLTLLSYAPCKLKYSTSLNETPLSVTSSDAHIYVPTSLYSEYINDANWSTYASKITTTSDNIIKHNQIIFYINEDSDEEVDFYDKDGNLIQDIGVGTEFRTYNITKPDSNGLDKYYVCYPYCEGSYPGRKGYALNLSELSGSGIGYGRTNTSKIMQNYTPDSSSVYCDYKVYVNNTYNMGGFNDWYIPSKLEAQKLGEFMNLDKYSYLSSPLSSRILTSTSYSTSTSSSSNNFYAYGWGTGEFYEVNSINSYYNCCYVPIRSF